MPTLGELVERHEESLFVGREELLEDFRDWLTDTSTRYAIFNVTGHGGVGKTALLRAFARVAREEGRNVRLVDGHELDLAPASLHAAVGASDAAETIETLNAELAVLLLDSFESVAGLTRHLLDDLVPRLDASVRVVVASRRRLLDRAHRHPLADFVREVRPSRFDAAEMREYLRRRGIEDPADVNGIQEATRGNPLAVSIAADLVTQLDVHDIRRTEDWEHTVEQLADRFLSGLEQDTRRLLDAASVVRQFDLDTLTAMVQPCDPDTFRDLTSLAMVRPAGPGLRLHDDVRHLLADRLRRRDPARYHELRSRALRHYRSRLETASPEERAWLVNERLYLWEHDFVRTALFPQEDGVDDIFLEVARPEDRRSILELWRRWSGRVSPIQGGAPSDDLTDGELEALVHHPGSRIVLARHRDGKLLAAGIDLPLASETLDVAPRVLRPLVDAYLGGERPLPNEAATSGYRYLGPIFGTGDHGDAAMSRLARWAIGSWIHGGTLLVGTTMAGYAGLMEMLGFERVPVDAGDRQVHALVLELEADDVERWIQRITDLTPPADPPAAAPDTGLEVRLLGTFALVREGEDLTPSGLPAAAVKHVALADGTLHADELAERLWPDAAPGTGRSRLRNVLKRLRQTSGDVLVRDGDTVRLPDGARVDVQLFADAANLATARGGQPAEARRLAEQAIERYGGDLLPGDPYEDRFVAPRERLRRLLVSAHDVLAEASIAEDNVDGAVQSLRQAIELDPYDERRYVRTAQVLARDGRSGQALRTLRRAREMCDHLGVAPSPRIEALERRLLGQSGGGQTA